MLFCGLTLIIITALVPRCKTTSSWRKKRQSRLHLRCHYHRHLATVNSCRRLRRKTLAFS